MIESRLLPEFAPQSGVLLTWPHARTDWSGMLQAVEAVYTEITLAISSREPALIICHDEILQQRVSGILARAGISPATVQYAIAASNDTWIRDYGPLGVLEDGEPALLDFTFDGWGGKHPAGLDNTITQRLCTEGRFGATPCSSPSVVLEGGSIDTDGRGTLLTTTRCLLGSQRNPGYDRQALQSLCQSRLGTRQILWLEHGYLAGDDTDGHIDMLARFCSPDTLVYTCCEDSGDEHYREHQAMERQLSGFRNSAGEPYHCMPLPLPPAVYAAGGQRLPASYANFLIINAAVLVPVYAAPTDERACRVLADCFPGREIVPVNCLPLIQQFGSLHCATMQLAEGILAPGPLPCEADARQQEPGR